MLFRSVEVHRPGGVAHAQMGGTGRPAPLDALDQNIAYVLTKESPKTVALYVNNVIYTDDKDISWLYDVAFERLVGQVDWVVCSGSRAYDLAVRLELAGFDRDHMIIEDDNSKLREAMKRSEGTIWVLAASAFGDEDGILEVLR